MRFGLDSSDDELGPRELMLIQAALRVQRSYCLNLAKKNTDPEAQGRNLTNALELKVLMDKLELKGSSL